MSNIDVQWPFFGYIYFATNNYYGYSVLVSTLHVNLNGLDDQNKSKLKIYNEFSAKLATLAASFGSSILTFLFMGSMSPYYFKTIFRQCIEHLPSFIKIGGAVSEKNGDIGQKFVFLYIGFQRVKISIFDILMTKYSTLANVKTSKLTKNSIFCCGLFRFRHL